MILAGALLTITSAALMVQRRHSSTARLVAHSDFLDGNRDIHLRVPGSLHNINLTHDPGIDSQPTWSPNAEWIAFVTDRDTPAGKYPINSVYLMRRDGSDLRKLGLASPTTGTRTLIWSPDSQWLYVKYVMQGWWDNYMVRVADGHSITLRFNNAYTVLSKWSPREPILAYETSVRGAVNENETAVERVRPGESSQPNILSSFTSSELLYDFAWSADGQWIALARQASYDRHVLQRRHPDGSGLLNLYTSDTPLFYPTWSPDGEQIAFVTGDEKSSAIYLVHSDGSDAGAARLLDEAPAFYTSPAWSPDGKTLVYAGYDGQKGTLYQFTMNDDTIRPIFQAEPFIHHIRWSGEWIYFASGNSGQAQLYQIRPDGSDLTYLTDTAFDWELPISSPISLGMHSEILLLAGLLLIVVGISPYPIGRRNPPRPLTGRHFVLNQ